MSIELSNEEKIKIINSHDLYGIMQRILLRENEIDRDREHFWVIGLANNNRLLFIELVSKGSQAKVSVEPMEVFSFALQKRAARIMLVHNHPSGELKPSYGDKDITDHLIQVGIIVNTPVLDHLIITTTTYLSFLDVGLMEQLEKSTLYVPKYKQIKALKDSGSQARAEEIALKCLKDQMDVAYIVELTGLSETEINDLAKKNGLD
jgi:DNA repair protein RadC